MRRKNQKKPLTSLLIRLSWLHYAFKHIIVTPTTAPFLSSFVPTTSRVTFLPRLLPCPCTQDRNQDNFLALRAQTGVFGLWFNESKEAFRCEAQVKHCIDWLVEEARQKDAAATPGIGRQPAEVCSFFVEFDFAFFTFKRRVIFWDSERCVQRKQKILFSLFSCMCCHPLVCRSLA